MSSECKPWSSFGKERAFSRSDSAFLRVFEALLLFSPCARIPWFDQKYEEEDLFTQRKNLLLRSNANTATLLTSNYRAEYINIVCKFGSLLRKEEFHTHTSGTTSFELFFSRSRRRKKRSPLWISPLFGLAGWSTRGNFIYGIGMNYSWSWAAALAGSAGK